MQQSYPNIEVLVVCDGEDEDVHAIAQDFRGAFPVRWIFHPVNRGLPAARNTGAREAQGDIVLFFDDDVIADRELVATHMSYHQDVAETRRIAVFSMTTEDRHSKLSSYVERCLDEEWKRTIDNFAATFSATELDSVSEEIERTIWFGLNCSIRRDIFLSSGGFNEHFRSSDEEVELGLRLYLAGVEFVFEPRRLLTHKNSKDLEKYFTNCWGASGTLHPYRVFELGQRNAQTQQLVSMFHGYLLDRLMARFAWHFSGPLSSFAHWLKFSANRTEWHFLFGAWARTCRSVEYWRHAKETRCTMRQLEDAVGPLKCAVMLHSIHEPASEEEASYYIAPSRFRRLMQWFRSAGFSTATTAQWLQDDLTDKQVLLTFDDGYDDLYRELLPVIIQNRYTPVIYLVADRIGASNEWDQGAGVRARKLLTLEQIREMQKYGVEFGSHSLTHPWLPSVSDEQLHHEVCDSKHRLEDLLGVEVTSFAYPFGGVDRRVRSAVANAGYKLAFTTLPGVNWWNDPLCQRRAEVNAHTTVSDFAWKLRNGLGFTESVGARLSKLEQDLPTKILRSLTRKIGRLGHQAVLTLSKEGQKNPDAGRQHDDA